MEFLDLLADATALPAAAEQPTRSGRHDVRLLDRMILTGIHKLASTARVRRPGSRDRCDRSGSAGHKPGHPTVVRCTPSRSRQTVSSAENAHPIRVARTHTSRDRQALASVKWEYWIDFVEGRSSHSTKPVRCQFDFIHTSLPRFFRQAPLREGTQ